MRERRLVSQARFEKFGMGQWELFLDQMVPWSELLVLIERHHPKAGSGRQPAGLAIKLRT